MIKEIQVQLLPSEANDMANLKMAIQQYLSIKRSARLEYEILKKSIDARGKLIKIIFKVRVYIDEPDHRTTPTVFNAQQVSKEAEVHIIGAGPAGLFCALQCIELGIKPVVFERGKKVRDRRRDLAILNK